MASATNKVDTNPLDLIAEDLLELCDAAKEVPPKGVAYQTIWRWCQRGIVINGERIKLETVKISQKRYTSRQAIHRFVKSQQV